jgi:hypothetical protein
MRLLPVMLQPVKRLATRPNHVEGNRGANRTAAWHLAIPIDLIPEYIVGGN